MWSFSTFCHQIFNQNDIQLSNSKALESILSLSLSVELLYCLVSKRSSVTSCLFTSVSSCNRLNITVGWTSCGRTSSRRSARRLRPWRTLIAFCWRTSCLLTWQNTSWPETGRTRWEPGLFLKCSYLHVGGKLTVLCRRKGLILEA